MVIPEPLLSDEEYSSVWFPKPPRRWCDDD